VIDEAPVTRRARISHDYTEKRFLAAAMATQPDDKSH
jgi:hypothetical protein